MTSLSLSDGRGVIHVGAHFTFTNGTYLGLGVEHGGLGVGARARHHVELLQPALLRDVHVCVCDDESGVDQRRVIGFY